MVGASKRSEEWSLGSIHFTYLWRVIQSRRMKDLLIVNDRNGGLTSSGGVHHIAALVENPSLYKIHKRTEIPNSSGCYRAKIYKNGVEMHSSHPDGKSFFPDSWDEYKVMDAIKEAYSDPERLFISDNTYEGRTSSGLINQMFLDQSGKVISSFPK